MLVKGATGVAVTGSVETNQIKLAPHSIIGLAFSQGQLKVMFGYLCSRNKPKANTNGIDLAPIHYKIQSTTA